MTRSSAIRAGLILARPGAEPPRGPCEILIADGKIAQIKDVAHGELTGEEAGLILLPALANAHDHGRGLRTLAYGAPDTALEQWLPELARQPWLDAYQNAALAFARMATGGICAANHCHNTIDSDQLLQEAEGVSRAARDVGLRIAFALPFQDRNPNVYGDLDRLLEMLPAADRPAVVARARAMRSLETNMALIEQINDLEHETFLLQYGPVAPQWTAHETLAAIARASEETGRRVHMHLLETRLQREWSDYAYPDGLLSFLDQLGILSPRLTVAHGVWLRPDEAALLAERGVTVSVNTSSNLRLRSGDAPIADLRKAGVRFGLGLDGMSFEDDEDMLRELRLAWHRQAGEANAMTPEELFAAACIVGRKTIVGEDGGGMIIEGAPADLMALDLAAMTADCIHTDIDLLGILLVRMKAAHLRLLLIGGKAIVVDGKCVTVDAARLEADLTQAARAVYQANPPDLARIDRLRDSVSRSYAAGHHCGRPENG